MTSRSFVAMAMLCIVAPATSFLYNPTVNPDLSTFAQASLGKLLKIRLDVGRQAASTQRISLQGPVFKLLDGVTKTLKLPGAHGPTPQISSGSKSVEIVKDGFVIDMNGMKTIPFQDGCWEMIWKEGARCGTMVCGFKLPEPVKRNAASIPACEVYMSFPVWTKEGLVGAQAMREEVLDTRRGFLNEKQEAIDDMMQAKNLFSYAKHYHKAAQAVEKAYNTPNIENIPDIRDTIELSSGLLMTKKGVIFNREPGFAGARQNLGYATVEIEKSDVVGE